MNHSPSSINNTHESSIILRNNINNNDRSPRSLVQQAMFYPRQMRANNSVAAMANEKKRVWIPSGNPGSKHTKKFVGYSIKRFYFA